MSRADWRFLWGRFCGVPTVPSVTPLERSAGDRRGAQGTLSCPRGTRQSDHVQLPGLFDQRFFTNAIQYLLLAFLPSAASRGVSWFVFYLIPLYFRQWWGCPRWIIINIPKVSKDSGLNMEIQGKLFEKCYWPLFVFSISDPKQNARSLFTTVDISFYALSHGNLCLLSMVAFYQPFSYESKFSNAG